MGKCVTCLRWTVLLYNTIFWLFGLGLLGLGIYLRVDPTITPALEGSDNLQRYYVATYILMAVGALMACIGFVGFCGALRESRGCLATFFGLMFIVLVAEVAGGVVLYLHKNELTRSVVETGFVSLVRQDFGKPDFRTKTEYFDTMQAEMECCGARSYTDWFGSSWSGGTNDIGSNSSKQFLVPTSCCKKQFRGQDVCKSTSDRDGILLNLMNDNADMINQRGCTSKLFDVVEMHRSALIGIVVSVAVMQIFGMIFAITLCCSIKPDGYSYKS